MQSMIAKMSAEQKINKEYQTKGVQNIVKGNAFVIVLIISLIVSISEMVGLQQRYYNQLHVHANKQLLSASCFCTFLALQMSGMDCNY